MAGLIDNKDRIIDTFNDIQLSIINKGITPIGDVTSYSQAVLDIPQEYSGASSIKLGTGYGTYYWVPSGASEQYKAFTLNTYGRNFFTNSGTISKCIVGGVFYINIGSCLIGDSNTQVITQVKKTTGEVLAEAIGTNKVVESHTVKILLSVDDEITIYSTYLGDTPTKRYHLAQLSRMFI